MHVLIDRDPRLKHDAIEKPPIVVLVNDFDEKVHRTSGWTSGTAPIQKVDADETARLDRLIFETVATNCRIPVATLLDPMHDREGGDWFLTADDAKALGLVDHVGVPALKVTAAVAMEIEL